LALIVNVKPLGLISMVALIRLLNLGSTLALTSGKWASMCLKVLRVGRFENNYVS
jgi:hypothetical protein